MEVGCGYTTDFEVEGQPSVVLPNVDKGTTFYVQVDGYHGASGLVRLQIGLGEPLSFRALPASQWVTAGSKATFNATIGERSHPPQLWVSPFHFGINQGPIVLMIENFRTGLIWSLMRQCSYLVVGLDRAGFTGGWLGGQKTGRPD